VRALIVNADDFAYSLQVSAGICEAFEHGVVTETTLLVRSPWARQSLVQARACGLPVGLHLDLTSPFMADRAPRFGPEGKFCHELFAREFRRTPPPGLTCEDLLACRGEMQSQIAAFADLAGRLPTHLDYHYGLHHIPEIMALYVIVAEQHRLPIRWCERHAGRSPYPLVPDSYCDDYTGRDDAPADGFVRLAEESWEGVREAACHPGHITPVGLADPYNGGRARELAALTTPALKTALAERGVRLVGFDWLKARLSQ